MKRKDKRVSVKDLSNRLENDENAWLKQLSTMGDFARFWRRMEAQIKKDRRVILRLHKRIVALDLRVKTLEGSNPNNVAQR
jgi:lysozyme family protein